MLTDEYITYLSSVRRYSPRTVEIYADVLRRFVEYSCDASSDKALKGALTSAGIRNYEVHLLDEKKESPRTVHLHLSVLSGFCRFLVRQGAMASNPVPTVSRPKVAHRLPDVFREEALQKYMERTAADAGPDTLSLITGRDKASVSLYNRRLQRLVISLLWGTGIRRSELVSLQVGSVDFSRRVLRVRGKGDKMREIPLIPSLCEEISLYLQATGSLTGCRPQAADPLLVTSQGRPLYPVYVDRAVKAALGQQEDVTGRKSPHVLRHTLATELLDAGADLNSIKELLGHASLAATQVYTHNSVEKLKKVYLNAHPRAKRGGNHGD